MRSTTRKSSGETPSLIDGSQKLIPAYQSLSENPAHVRLPASYERARQAVEPLAAFVTLYQGQTKVFESPALQSRQCGMPGPSAPDALHSGINICRLENTIARSRWSPASQKAAFWRAPVQLAP